LTWIEVDIQESLKQRKWACGMDWYDARYGSVASFWEHDV